MSRKLGAFLVVLLPASLACGQADFLDVNERTLIRSVSYSFTDSPREARLFSEHELNAIVTTKAPRLQDRLAETFGLGSPEPFILDPIELQRDVVRLRTAYSDAGYLRAQVDYAGSQVDTTANRIDILFTIRQGLPVIIQDVGFFAEAGYLAYAFENSMREQWIEFRDATSFKTGDRFNAFEVIRIEDQVLGWLKDQGFAFPNLQTTVEVDSMFNVADIGFMVDPGPIGTVSSILIEGDRRVDDRVIRRAMPFKEGDPFVQEQLFEAQRSLFALNLFSVAQVSVPDQPRDSTVVVLVTVQQARLRHISAEGGYHQRTGLTGQGTFSKRNFLGGGRLLTASLDVESGLLAFTETAAQVSRRLRTSIAVGLPQLGFKWLNATIEPYLQFELDPLLDESDRFLEFNRRSYGLNNSWYLGDLRTRAISIRYLVSRETQYSAERTDYSGPSRDAYDHSVLALSGTLARTDDYLRPTRGWVIRPTIEQAGIVERFIGVKGLGLDYVKARLDITGYIPLGRRQQLTLRAGWGKIWPSGIRSVTYYTADGPVVMDSQFAAPYENRYDAVRFYAGGASDVRGWSTGFAGAKTNRTESADDDGDALSNTFFEPAGGLARLFFSTELQIPITGVWHAAAFVDAGQVSSFDTPNCTAPMYRDPALSLPASPQYDVQCGIADSGRLNWNRFKVGAGVGIRYDTPVGFIRLDVAVKVNPDPLDLQSPENAFRSAQGVVETQQSDWRRINVHFSIGQLL